MASKPPFLQPIDDDAARIYALLNNATGGSIDSQVTRNLVMVALSAVGRGGWDQRSTGLATVRAGLYDWSSRGKPVTAR